jgi:hypothetical protein
MKLLYIRRLKMKVVKQKIYYCKLLLVIKVKKITNIIILILAKVVLVVRNYRNQKEEWQVNKLDNN